MAQSKLFSELANYYANNPELNTSVSERKKNKILQKSDEKIKKIAQGEQPNLPPNTPIPVQLSNLGQIGSDGDSTYVTLPNGQQQGVRGLNLDTPESTFYANEQQARQNQINHLSQLYGIPQQYITPEAIQAEGHRATNKFNKLATEGQGELDPATGMIKSVDENGNTIYTAPKANLTYNPEDKRFPNEQRIRGNLINPATGVSPYQEITKDPQFNAYWFSDKNRAQREAYEKNNSNPEDPYSNFQPSDEMLLAVQEGVRQSPEYSKELEKRIDNPLSNTVPGRFAWSFAEGAINPVISGTGDLVTPDIRAKDITEAKKIKTLEDAIAKQDPKFIEKGKGRRRVNKSNRFKKSIVNNLEYKDLLKKEKNKNIADKYKEAFTPKKNESFSDTVIRAGKGVLDLMNPVKAVQNVKDLRINNATGSESNKFEKIQASKKLKVETAKVVKDWSIDNTKRFDRSKQMLKQYDPDLYKANRELDSKFNKAVYEISTGKKVDIKNLLETVPAGLKAIYQNVVNTDLDSLAETTGHTLGLVSKGYAGIATRIPGMVSDDINRLEKDYKKRTGLDYTEQEKSQLVALTTLKNAVDLGITHTVLKTPLNKPLLNKKPKSSKGINILENKNMFSKKNPKNKKKSISLELGKRSLIEGAEEGGIGVADETLQKYYGSGKFKASNVTEAVASGLLLPITGKVGRSVVNTTNRFATGATKTVLNKENLKAAGKAGIITGVGVGAVGYYAGKSVVGAVKGTAKAADTVYNYFNDKGVKGTTKAAVNKVKQVNPVETLKQKKESFKETKTVNSKFEEIKSNLQSSDPNIVKQTKDTISKQVEKFDVLSDIATNKENASVFVEESKVDKSNVEKLLKTNKKLLIDAEEINEYNTPIEQFKTYVKFALVGKMNSDSAKTSVKTTINSIAGSNVIEITAKEFNIQPEEIRKVITNSLVEAMPSKKEFAKWKELADTVNIKKSKEEINAVKEKIVSQTKSNEPVEIAPDDVGALLSLAAEGKLETLDDKYQDDNDIIIRGSDKPTQSSVKRLAKDLNDLNKLYVPYASSPEEVHKDLTKQSRGFFRSIPDLVSEGVSAIFQLRHKDVSRVKNKLGYLLNAQEKKRSTIANTLIYIEENKDKFFDENNVFRGSVPIKGIIDQKGKEYKINTDSGYKALKELVRENGLIHKEIDALNRALEVIKLNENSYIYEQENIVEESPSDNEQTQKNNKEKEDDVKTTKQKKTDNKQENATKITKTENVAYKNKEKKIPPVKNKKVIDKDVVSKLKEAAKKINENKLKESQLKEVNDHTSKGDVKQLQNIINNIAEISKSSISEDLNKSDTKTTKKENKANTEQNTKDLPPWDVVVEPEDSNTAQLGEETEVSNSVENIEEASDSEIKPEEITDRTPVRSLSKFKRKLFKLFGKNKEHNLSKDEISEIRDFLSLVYDDVFTEVIGNEQRISLSVQDRTEEYIQNDPLYKSELVTETGELLPDVINVISSVLSEFFINDLNGFTANTRSDLENLFGDNLDFLNQDQIESLYKIGRPFNNELYGERILSKLKELDLIPKDIKKDSQTLRELKVIFGDRLAIHASMFGSVYKGDQRKGHMEVTAVPNKVLDKIRNGENPSIEDYEGAVTYFYKKNNIQLNDGDPKDPVNIPEFLQMMANGFSWEQINTLNKLIGFKAEKPRVSFERESRPKAKDTLLKRTLTKTTPTHIKAVNKRGEVAYFVKNHWENVFSKLGNSNLNPDDYAWLFHSIPPQYIEEYKKDINFNETIEGKQAQAKAELKKFTELLNLIKKKGTNLLYLSFTNRNPGRLFSNNNIDTVNTKIYRDVFQSYADQIQKITPNSRAEDLLLAQIEDNTGYELDQLITLFKEHNVKNILNTIDNSATSARDIINTLKKLPKIFPESIKVKKGVHNWNISLLVDSLITLDNYLDSTQTKQEYTSHIAIKMDGTTHGAATVLTTLSPDYEAAKDIIKGVGIVTKDNINTKSIDLYQRTVKESIDELNNLSHGVTGDVLANTGTKILNKILGDDFYKLDDNGNLLEVTKTGRNFTKNPVTQIIYGAQRRAITNTLISYIRDGLKEHWYNANYNNDIESKQILLGTYYYNQIYDLVENSDFNEFTNTIIEEDVFQYIKDNWEGFSENWKDLQDSLKRDGIDKIFNLESISESTHKNKDPLNNAADIAVTKGALAGTARLYSESLFEGANNFLGDSFGNLNTIRTVVDVAALMTETIIKNKIKDYKKEKGFVPDKETIKKWVLELKKEGITPSIRPIGVKKGDYEHYLDFSQIKANKNNVAGNVATKYNGSYIKYKQLTPEGITPVAKNYSSRYTRTLSYYDYDFDGDLGVKVSPLSIINIESAIVSNAIIDLKGNVVTTHDALAINANNADKAKEIVNTHTANAWYDYNMMEAAQEKLELLEDYANKHNLDLNQYVYRKVKYKGKYINPLIRNHKSLKKYVDNAVQDIENTSKKLKERTIGIAQFDYEAAPKINKEIPYNKESAAKSPNIIFKDETIKRGSDALNDIDKETFKAIDDIEINAENIEEFFDSLSEDIEGNLDTTHKNHLKQVIKDIIIPGLKESGKASVKIKDALRNSGEAEFKIIEDVAKDINIYLNKAKHYQVDPSSQSIEEVFIHEMLHPIVEVLLKNNDTYKLEVQRLFNLAKKHANYKLFLPKDRKPTKADVYKAQAMYEHLFDSDAELHEFASYIYVNKNLKETIGKINASNFSNTELKGKTLYDRIENLILKAIAYIKDFIQGFKSGDLPGNQDIAKSLMYMTYKHQNAKNTVINHISNTATLAPVKIMRFFNKKLIGSIATPLYRKYMRNAEYIVLSDAAMEDPLTVPSKLKKAWLLPYLYKKGELQHTFSRILRDGFNLNKDNVVYSIINTIAPSKYSAKYEERRRILRRYLDKSAMDTIAGISNNIADEFNRKLSIREWEALKNVATRSDMHTLLSKGRTLKDIHSLLTDEKALKEEIRRVESNVLKDFSGKNKTTVLSQINGLGRYMATGEVSLKQLLNTYNIVNYASIVKGKQIVDEVFVREKGKELESLATLYALKHANKEDKRILAQTLARDVSTNYGKGFIHYIQNLETVRKEYISTVLRGDISQIVMGDTYHKTGIHDFSLSKPNDKKLKRDGYIETKQSIVYNGKRYTIYYSPARNSRTFARGSLGITSKVQRGKLLKSHIREHIDEYDSNTSLNLEERVRIAYKKEKIKLITQFKRGESTDNLRPIIVKNQIVDFEFVLPTETKKNVFTNTSENLGHMDIAHQLGRIDSYEAGYVTASMTFEELFNDYKKDNNKKGKDFVFIGSNSSSERYKQLWNMLPAYAQKEAKKAFGVDGFYIPEEIIDNVVGSFDASIGNTLQKAGLITANIAKFYFKIARIHKAIISAFKRKVVINNTEVLHDNTVSNIFTALQTNVPLAYMIKQTPTVLKRINKYIALDEKINNLQQKKRVFNNKSQINKISKAIQSLERERSRLGLDELMEAGAIQTLIEDVNVAKDEFISLFEDLSSDKRNSQMVNLLDKAPFLSDIYKSATLSPTAEVGQLALRITQNSDLVFKVMLYDWFTKHAPKSEQLTKDKATKLAVESYIYYDYNDHKYVRWLSDNGYLPFVKFGLNIQRVIVRNIRRNPMNTITTEFVQEIFGDQPDIIDNNLLIDFPGWVNPDLETITDQATRMPLLDIIL